MNNNTYQVAFTVTVDKSLLPPAIDLASEITYRVRGMVRQELAHTALSGVTFDQQTVVVVEVDGVQMYQVTFQVNVGEGYGYWPAHTSMEQEIARRTSNMVERGIAWLPGYSIGFNPTSVNVTKVTGTPTTSTAPTSTMRPGVTPAPVAFSHAATEPVTADPAKRGWRRLFGRG